MGPPPFRGAEDPPVLFFGNRILLFLVVITGLFGVAWFDVETNSNHRDSKQVDELRDKQETHCV